jgi:hypothetical protein
VPVGVNRFGGPAHGRLRTLSSGAGPRNRAANATAIAVCVAICALLGALPGIAKAQSGPDQVRGVQLTPNYAFSPPPAGQSAADDASEISAACSLGAGVVREFVSWPTLEVGGPGMVNGDYAAKLDGLVQQASACGMKVIFNLLGTPWWDSVAQADTHWSAFPAKDGASQYRWMVGWILNRWPGLYGLEVWNEPDLANWWRGTPAQYADLVNAAVAAKSDAGAGTLVLAGALARPGSSYLQSLYAAGMRGQDAVSLHPYSAVCTVQGCQLYDPEPQTSPFRSEIEGIHQVMAANGDASGMWLTEFGFPTCPSQPTCVPEDVQADWMAKSVQIAACYAYVTGLTAFDLRDTPVAADLQSDWNYHFGLSRADFTPKPSFDAVAAKYRWLSQASSTDRTLACIQTVGSGLIGAVTAPQPPADGSGISPSDTGTLSPGGTPPPPTGGSTPTTTEPAPLGQGPVARKKCRKSKKRAARAAKKRKCKKRR